MMIRSVSPLLPILLQSITRASMSEVKEQGETLSSALLANAGARLETQAPAELAAIDYSLLSPAMLEQLIKMQMAPVRRRRKKRQRQQQLAQEMSEDEQKALFYRHQFD